MVIWGFAIFQSDDGVNGGKVTEKVPFDSYLLINSEILRTMLLVYYTC